MTLLFLYLFFALFTSFLCSLVEATLLSTPYASLRAGAEGGDKISSQFLHFKDDIDRPLSAILTLNTIAHTVGAAGVGAQATLIFGEAYFGLVSAILTLLILIFTEIIPKTLGANYYVQLRAFTLNTITIMMFITYPFVVASTFLTKILSKNEGSPTTSREEISALANIGMQEGIFGNNENVIIQNILRLKRVVLSEIMTPRVVVVSANQDMPLQEFLKNKDFLHFSRIPIYREHSDSITGYIFREEVFEKLAEDQFDLTLKDIKREILKLSEHTTLFVAWEEMLNKKEHIALIVDDYGGMDGVVSLEDIIETLLGFEILDEKDTIADLQKYAMERWKKKQKKYQMLAQNQNL